MDTIDYNILFSDCSIDVKVIEQIIRQPNIIDVITDYIRDNIIANTATDFSQSAESEEEIKQFDQISNMFINEGQILVQNLSKVLNKYMIVKPNEFVNIDLTNSWYSSERPIIQKSISELCTNSPFYNKPLISKVLTILTKLVDYICTLYANKIQMYNYIISEYEHRFNEVNMSSISVIQYSMMKLMMEQKITVLRKSINEIKDNLSNFNIHTKIVRSYYIKLFDVVRNSDTNHLEFVPINVLDIFDSFLSNRIKLDSENLNFYLDNYHLMPSSFRSKYIFLLINMINSVSTDSEIKMSICKFFAADLTIGLILEDAEIIYDKLMNDPSIIKDLIDINHIIYIIMITQNHINTHIEQISSIRLIKYVSICLSSMSKILEIRDKLPSETICFDILYEYLFVILNIVKSKPDIMDSYLVFRLPTILYEYYSIKCLDQSLNKSLEENKYKISNTIDEIFDQISTVKLVPIYLANQLSDSVDEIEQIQGKFSLVIREKIFKWINIYKKIFADSDIDDELIDPLTSTIIVIPCYIPMNEDQTITKVCDLNMISSYLWSKPENPYTRQILTIDDLIRYNQLKTFKDNKDQFNQKLKQLIVKYT